MDNIYPISSAGLEGFKREWWKVNSSWKIYDMKIGPNGSIYLAGYDTAIDDELWAAKLNNSGEVEWTLSWGGSVDERCGLESIALDSLGNIYIQGYTNSFGEGGNDLYLSKISNSGTLLWNVTWGGTGTEQGSGLAIDSSDIIYMTGYTNSFGAGGYDICVIKYDSSGNQLWNTTWGDNTHNEYASSIVLDSEDNLCIIGTISAVPGVDCLILKLNNTGSYLWHQIKNYNFIEQMNDVDVDSQDNLYITHFSASEVASCGLAHTFKYDKDGNFQWSITWGNCLGWWDVNQGIFIASDEEIYVSGYDEYSGGEDSMILIKYNSTGDELWYYTHDEVGNQQAKSVEMDPYGNIFLAGNDDLVKLNSLPHVTLNSPQLFDTFGLIAPNYNLTIIDSEITSMWYSVNDGINHIITESIGIINQTDWDNAPNGTVDLIFTIKDSMENIVSKNVTIRKGTPNFPPPILYPVSLETGYDGPVLLNWREEIDTTIYYIYRDTSPITSLVGLTPRGNTSELNYTDTYDEIGTYYYVITAGNGTVNSSISNCNSVTISQYVGAIHIDDTDPNKNWTISVTKKFWCSGSGTYVDPYLIRDIIVDGYNGTTNGILIENSNSYFKIENVTFYSSGNDILESGLNLKYVQNALIVNNTCYDNYYGGILLSDSSHNTIKNNYINDNSIAGIYLLGNSNNNNITNNIVYDNRGDGISISSNSDDTFIYRNNISNNDDGIYIIHSGCSRTIILENNLTSNLYYNIQSGGSSTKIIRNYVLGSRIYIAGGSNLIDSNYVINCGYSGIFLYYGGAATIVNNTILNSGRGIYFRRYSSNSIVYNNAIINNSGFGVGIYADNCKGNMIYNNSFIGNTLHAEDNMNPGDNYWNSTKVGNYWDDYSSTDSDDNGIGDTSYTFIQGAASSIDYLPIFEDGDDSEPPMLEIMSPITNQIFEKAPPSFQVSSESLYINSSWYSLKNATYQTENQSFTIGIVDTIAQSLWNEMSDGSITIEFYANDSLGNMNSYQVIIKKDNNAPIINIINPVDYNLYGLTPPIFDLSITESNLNTTWYSLNYGINYTFSGLDNFITYKAWGACGNGTVIIRFYANDSIGNLNFEEVIIRKDIINPEIIIQNPENSELFGNNTINFEILVNKPNIDSIWYNLNNGKNYTTYSLSGIIDLEAWRVCGNGSVVIKFYANDTVGNMAFQEIVIWKDIENPSIIIVSPDPFDLFGNQTFTFELSISDPNLMTTWYTINNGGSHYFSGTIDIIDPIEWDLCQNGTVLITFYANDSLGNTGFSIITIRKDILNPDLTIISPNPDDIYGILPFDFELSIIEPNIDTTWCILNGELIFFFSGQMGTIDPSMWDLCADDTVAVVFYVNDTGGNFVYKEVIIRKDTSPPESTLSLILNEPTNIINKSTIISFEAFDVGDFGVKRIEYAINDSNWFIYTEPFNLSIYKNGYYLISYRAIDNGGNVEETKFLLVELKGKSETVSEPSSIPGYNFNLIIITFTCIITILLKRLQSRKIKTIT